MPTPANNAFVNNRFTVQIDSIGTLDFVEVILPEARAEIIEYREGGERAAHKIVGNTHLSNLVLKRGVTESQDLFKWWQNIANGIPDRRNGTVNLLDAQQSPVKYWKLQGIWPARYAVSPLIAVGEAAVLIEVIECAVEGFMASNPGQ